MLRKLALQNEAATLLDETLSIDPLDWWAAHLQGREIACDSQVRFDLALDYANAGFYTEAIELLLGAAAEKDAGTAPLIEYYHAYFHQKSGDIAGALHHYRLGAAAASDYCFPSRLEEILILTAAINANPQDAQRPIISAICSSTDAVRWTQSHSGKRRARRIQNFRPSGEISASHIST